MGVPTWMVKEDQGPSYPSLDSSQKESGKSQGTECPYQFCEGAMEIGVGTADAVARSIRASLEADASTMYCESQRRQGRAITCILSRPAPEGLHQGYQCALGGP